jgi:hypothetical protein
MPPFHTTNAPKPAKTRAYGMNGGMRSGSTAVRLCIDLITSPVTILSTLSSFSKMAYILGPASAAGAS